MLLKLPVTFNMTELHSLLSFQDTIFPLENKSFLSSHAGGRFEVSAAEKLLFDWGMIFHIFGFGPHVSCGMRA